MQLAQDKKIIKVAGFGEIDQVLSDERVECDFSPAGNMDADVLAWIYRGLLSQRASAPICSERTTRPRTSTPLDDKLLKLDLRRADSVPDAAHGRRESAL